MDNGVVRVITVRHVVVCFLCAVSVLMHQVALAEPALAPVSETTPEPAAAEATTEEPATTEPAAAESVAEPVPDVAAPDVPVPGVPETAVPVAPVIVNLDLIVEKAKQLAQQDYQPHNADLPQSLKSLSYDQYRAIRFDPEQAVWHGEAMFEAQFFHPGFIYRESVLINLLDREGVPHPYPYDKSHFIMGEPVADLKVPAGSKPGYSGFRIHFPLNTDQYKDEVVVFQGASYFRLVGPGQVYGLSARGLAIDTALPSGEEFPRFVEFWLQQPVEASDTLVMYALLDSPSVTGAYRFELTPGLKTDMLVEARLYPRTDVDKLGVAPLTSMFFYGENSVNKQDDYRPEVHDSDGLLIENASGEWIWRPLNNPAALGVVSFGSESLKGFGLMQRDRNFDHYLDAGAHYDKRPGLWVQPVGDWGKGRIELVEIPTGSETNDNIVAYWVPDKKVKAGQEWRFSYRLTTVQSGLAHANRARIERTRNGWGYAPGAKRPPRDLRQFIVDFSADDLKGLSAEQNLKADLSVRAGTSSDLKVNYLEETRQWRVSFKVQPDEDKTADMRLLLTLHGRPVSEVWNYVWNRNELEQ